MKCLFSIFIIISASNCLFLEDNASEMCKKKIKATQLYLVSEIANGNTSDDLLSLVAVSFFTDQCAEK